MKVYPTHISKNNLNCENQIILLIFKTKKDDTILQKYDGDFYSLIVFICLEQKTNLNLIKKYLKIEIFVVL